MVTGLIVGIIIGSFSTVLLIGLVSGGGKNAAVFQSGSTQITHEE